MLTCFQNMGNVRNSMPIEGTHSFHSLIVKSIYFPEDRESLQFRTQAENPADTIENVFDAVRAFERESSDIILMKNFKSSSTFFQRSSNVLSTFFSTIFSTNFLTFFQRSSNVLSTFFQRSFNVLSTFFRILKVIH